ncbi:MAG: aminomethyl-transferring glycine dehydrogenase, partial [Alistipes sp.]|nr:aminomethyl-transferring glycine dehydrogenase [Alistipes sp.]
ADILSLALLTPPAEWGADIAVGSTQRLGCPMGFGGPSAGYMACREAYKRNITGRIIGVSVDRLGNNALRMSLQMREQHIKREKATSNICTASALMASMAGFYCIYNGPEGLRRAAMTAHTSAVAAAEALKALGYKLATNNIFDTLEVEAEAAVIQDIALETGFNFFYPSEGCVRLSFDEVTTPAEVEAVVAIFAEAKGKKAKAVKIAAEPAIAESMLRKSPILAEPIFNRYHSESDMMRYIKQLELRDISLANSMISLGSCTMKLNAAAIMQPLSLSGFQNMHPFAPADQTEGYTQLISELEQDLATITGFAGCSLQPNSGAAGEYTGLMVIRAYHQSRNQGYRNIILIPASAHGTNPASAAMAGMKIVTVACDQNGNIDVEDLKQKAEEHSSELCGLMVTYPSTHGVFESRIREIVDAVHDAGGQVYMDGANMNAQVGLTNPGYIGADVCHLNLHKTFAMPHGGGGPGVGPICVAEHLKPFLPSHSIMTTGGEDGITAVASSPWGSAMLLPITYGYIKMLGEEGLRHSTEMAIVNANYMSSALKNEYRTYYSGETGRVGHEMILDLTHFKHDFGIDCGDIAHRLMDYGFHAPTLSFPVHETLMVEPTESEPKAEMDRFMEALIQIKRECEAAAASGEKDNVVVNAPHTAVELAGEWSHPYSRMEAAFPLDWVRTAKFFPYVTKIDNGYGDRNLVCCNVD